MPEVFSLINAGLISRADFIHDLNSLTKDGVRYIYRCNSERALETQRQREERFETAQRKAEQENAKLRVIMLAHMIVRELRKSWESFDLTVEEGLSELSFICRHFLNLGEKKLIAFQLQMPMQVYY